jgi:hypothetical protein
MATSNVHSQGDTFLRKHFLDFELGSTRACETLTNLLSTPCLTPHRFNWEIRGPVTGPTGLTGVRATGPRPATANQVVFRRTAQGSPDLTLTAFDVIPALRTTTVQLPLTYNLSLVVYNTANVYSSPVFVPLVVSRT